MKFHVGVAAHGSGSDPERARRFVEALPSDVRILLGGYWGLMRDVAEAARRRGLQVIFFLPHDPLERVPEDDNFIKIDTGLDYKGRSVILVRSSDVLAVLGGEVGTVIEALMAYSYGKPVFILRNTGRTTDKLEKAFSDAFDERKTGPVFYADTPEELAAKIVLWRGGIRSLNFV
jgi:uncharacterized protein (TIGR00725 family)